MILRRNDILAAAIFGLAAIIPGSHPLLAADEAAQPAATSFQVPAVVPPPAGSGPTVESTLVTSRRAGLPEGRESWRIETPESGSTWGNDPWFRPGEAPARADAVPAFSLREALPELDEARPAITFETPATALPDACRGAGPGRCVLR